MFLKSARAQGVIVVDDLELVIRLLVVLLLTYVLSDGLFAPDGLPQAPPPERVAALVRLVLQAIPHPNHQEAH
jgi:hypothetical protein